MKKLVVKQNYNVSVLNRRNEKFKHEIHYHGALMAVNWRPFIEADGDGKSPSLIFNRGDSGLL